MNLHRLIAEYRKISRRLRRRALVASARQIQSWKRRLAYLEQRIRLAGGRSMRRAAMASALAAVALPQVAHAAASKVTFNQVDPGLSLIAGQNIYEHAQVAFGDIDGDGDLDAFVVSEDYDYVQFFQNQGNNRHPKFVDKTGDSSVNPMYGQYFYNDEEYEGITIADIDGDGDLDIVVGSWDLNFFKNVGTPTHPAFQKQYGPTDNPFYYISADGYAKPVLVDLDGDGDLDLLVGRYDYVSFYENVGTRTTPSFQYRYGAADPFDGMYLNTNRLYVTTGDIDGDGDIDVVVGGTGVYGVYLWENQGTKTHPHFVDRGYIPGVFSAPTSPTLADVDGDGDPDLFSGNWDGGLQNWTNVGTATQARFSQPALYYEPGDNVVFADVDNDGDIDQLSEGVFNRNDGNGTYQMRENAQNPFYYMHKSGRAFGDLDGDGDLDMVAFDGSYFHFYRQDGRPGQLHFTELTGSASPFNGTTNTPGVYWRNAALADVDGDGDLDLVVASYYGSGNKIQLFLNDGTRTAPHFSNVSNANNPFFALGDVRYSQLLLADMDGDGDMDLVVAGYWGANYGDSTGQRRYFRNDTNGPGMPVFTQVVGADDPFAATPSLEGTTMVVDYDHDGDLDLLLWNWDSASWKLLRNDTARFNKVDAVAQDKGRVILGPVPAKAGDDVCLFVDQVTDSLDFQLFNLAGERVINGLSSATSPGATPCFKADIAPGLYWAKIKSGDRTFTQKVIITAK